MRYVAGILVVLASTACGRVAAEESSNHGVDGSPVPDAVPSTDHDGALADAGVVDVWEDAASSTCAEDAPKPDAPAVVVDDAALAAIPRLRAGATMHDRRYGHLSFVTADGTLLVIGGYDATLNPREIEEYDPAADAWTIVAVWSDPNPNLWPVAGVELADGRPFVLGVELSPSGSGAEYAAFVFSRSAGRWVWNRVAAPPRYVDKAVRLDDGRVFAMDDAGDAAIYDAEKDAWQLAASTDFANAHLVAVDGDRVLAIPDPTGGAGNAHMWDAHTNTWSPVPRPPYGVFGAVLHIGRDRVAAMGANHAEPASHLVPDYQHIPTPLQILDLDTCEWTMAWTTHTMVWPTGAVLASGELLFIDGYAPFDTADPAPPSASGQFDPEGHDWTTYDALPTREWMPNVDVLPSGIVVITGGTNACGHGGCREFGHAETWLIDPGT